MKLFYINILQSNDLGDVLSKPFGDLIKKHNAVVMMPNQSEVDKYLIHIVFTDKETRNKFESEISSLIAYDVDEQEVSKEVWNSVINVEEDFKPSDENIM